MIFFSLKRHLLVYLLVIILPLSVLAKNLKIGIFTGTMDPPHLQHVQMVLDTINQLELDIVFYSPNFDPPHKPDVRPFASRRILAELAFKPIEKARLFDQYLLEIFQSKGLDAVLRKLRQHHPEADIYQIMGSDSVLRYRDRLAAAKLDFLNLVIISRKGEEINFLDLPEALIKKITVIPSTPNNISSTQVRKTLSLGKSSKMLSPEVNKAALESGLYKKESCAKNLTKGK